MTKGRHVGFRDHRVSVTQTSDYRWKLNRHVLYENDKTGDLLGVPEGYTTDFASVPRFIWWLVPTYGNYTAATVLHDWLITDMLPYNKTIAASPQHIDKVFREAMQSLGVSLPRRWLMWAGVRWGALFNPKRRKGSLRTLPGVLGISLLALPFVLPGVAVLPSLALFGVLERVCRG